MKRRRRWNQGYFFIFPAFLVLGVMVLYPLIDTVVLSVTDENGSYIGSRNFVQMLTSRTTSLATYNSIYYVGGSIILELILGTVAGILLDRHFVGRGIVRSIMLIPWVVPGTVAATTWAWMYHFEFGIINYGLQSLHVISGPVGWLTSAELVKPSLIVVEVWKMFPFVALMVLAALQGIPASLYEAARIDGATFYHEVRYIMLPHLFGILASVSLLLLIWGLNGITIIYAMTGGGPANRSLILPIQIFKEGFESFDFNRAAALSLVLFIVLFAVIVIQVSISQKRHGAANE
ncbi:carbohydrate ABC transporter permease [Chelativorans multitrophicus]|uniref:carbohydrate ABC transporter permease n=1 Tax=Chelativorans multitrophicus TaxID=449973 RepID=UPI001409E9F4|nr:sugar ABC transporter permease [Chelativorans multitrophicus]